MIKLPEPIEFVLVFNYSEPVKVQVADKLIYEVDLSLKPYFQVCWAHGWAGAYSSEEEANEECLNLCGYSRSTRMVKPTDEGYKDQRYLKLTEQRFPYYTESQLKQAVRDAYEDAAKVCENESCSCCWDDSATEMAAHLQDAIRALIKEVA